MIYIYSSSISFVIVETCWKVFWKCRVKYVLRYIFKEKKYSKHNSAGCKVTVLLFPKLWPWNVCGMCCIMFFTGTGYSLLYILCVITISYSGLPIFNLLLWWVLGMKCASDFLVLSSMELEHLTESYVNECYFVVTKYE